MSDLEQRIIKLESLMLYQDDTIDELSSHIYELQKEIQECRKELQQFKEAAESQQGGVEQQGFQKPPHY